MSNCLVCLALFFRKVRLLRSIELDHVRLLSSILIPEPSKAITHKMSTLDTRKANEGVFQNDEENGEEQIITDSVDVQQTALSIRIGDPTEPFVYI